MKLFLFYIGLTILLVYSVNGQSKVNLFLTPSDTLNKPRRNAVIITEGVVAASTLIGLNTLWYSDYPRSSFRTIDDSNEWLQMDKMGHIYASYQLGTLGANTLNWAGVSRKDQLIYGATLGFSFLTVVEVLDGFSQEWGFSWSDIAANAAGTGLYIGQDLLWHEQRILFKYSFHRTSYAQQRPDKLGEGFSEEFLKDYNGQTYWLSFNLKSFLKGESIPNWLNVAFGYGAEGMLTGSPNDDLFSDQNRIRQYYLSLDIDLSRIKTKSHFLKTLFDVLNLIKVPFPALEINSDGGIKMHYLYF